MDHRQNLLELYRTYHRCLNDGSCLYDNIAADYRILHSLIYGLRIGSVGRLRWRSTILRFEGTRSIGAPGLTQLEIAVCTA